MNDFNKKVIGDYENQQNEKMFLWEFWEGDGRHIFNLLKVGEEPNKKSGGFYCLSSLQLIKGNSIKMRALE